MLNRSFLSIGTNIGDRQENIRQAIKILEQDSNIDIRGISKVYETKPWGLLDQASFLNICVDIDVKCTADKLLSICQNIEHELKRERLVRWGPRTIDVDILFFNDSIIEEENLIVPHPRIQERAFVLVPLMDLDENLSVKGKNIRLWLESIGTDGIKEYKINDFKYFKR